MSGTAKVTFKVTNNTQTVEEPKVGVAFITGRSVRGPFNKPDEIITSWDRFMKKHGGLSGNLPETLLYKRLLEAGVSLRFSRMGHYTDITDSNTLDATKAEKPNVHVLMFIGEFHADNTISVDIEGETISVAANDTNKLETLVENIKSNSNLQSKINHVGYTTFDTGSNKAYYVFLNLSQATLSVNNSTTGGTNPPSMADFAETAVVSATNGNELFTLTPKYEGGDYNNIGVMVMPVAPGDLFTISVFDKNTNKQLEVFSNISLDPGNSIQDLSYLSQLESSDFITYQYNNVPVELDKVMPYSVIFINGSDGTTPVATDYIGDSSSKLGFFAFDNYEDSFYLAKFGLEDTSIELAGINYAKNRGDLIYFSHIPNDKATAKQIIDYVYNLGAASKLLHYTGGGLIIPNSLANSKSDASELADVILTHIKSDKEYGPWYSAAGNNRGIIRNSYGPINNFGTASKFKDLENLALHQVNMVIQRNGLTMLWGNFSGLIENSQEKFISIIKLLLYLKKALSPLLESFLEEPNDIPTWNRIYYTVKPFLDSLVTKRALYGYNWQGDQFATSMDDLVINNQTDVSLGKYKIKLAIQAIPSIQEIDIEIIMTKAGVQINF